MPQRSPVKAFTLVELLATITIIAVLVVSALFFTVSYVSNARLIAAKQNYTVLQDALNRFKGQGGGVAGLTVGTPIANVISAMKTPVNWVGLTQQFLNTSFTYPARSIYATGSGQSYHFTQVDTYVNEPGGTSPAAAPAFVAVPGGSSNTTIISADGINWTAGGNLPSSSLWKTVGYGDGKFVALAQGSTAAAYSTDGITWTSVTLPVGGAWKSVVCGGGRFVAVSYDISCGTVYSDDGITWHAGNLPTDGTYKWEAITYGNGYFVAADMNPSSCAHSAYSTDGINWTLVAFPAVQGWPAVAYGGSTFVAIAGSSNQIARSTDNGGSWNWSAGTLPMATANTVCYGGGNFVVFCGGNTTAAYSTDGGNTWNSSTVPSASFWNSVAYGGGTLVATSSTTPGAYSTDGGVSWTSLTLPSPGNWFVAAKQ